jgi:hypothetical protein
MESIGREYLHLVHRFHPDPENVSSALPAHTQRISLPLPHCPGRKIMRRMFWQSIADETKPMSYSQSMRTDVPVWQGALQRPSPVPSLHQHGPGGRLPPRRPRRPRPLRAAARPAGAPRARRCYRSSDTGHMRSPSIAPGARDSHRARFRVAPLVG